MPKILKFILPTWQKAYNEYIARKGVNVLLAQERLKMFRRSIFIGANIIMCLIFSAFNFFSWIANNYKDFNNSLYVALLILIYLITVLGLYRAVLGAICQRHFTLSKSKPEIKINPY